MLTHGRSDEKGVLAGKVMGPGQEVRRFLRSGNDVNLFCKAWVELIRAKSNEH